MGGTHDADATSLLDLVLTCEQKAIGFQLGQGLRMEEPEARNETIEIISDGSFAGIAREHFPTPRAAKASSSDEQIPTQ